MKSEMFTIVENRPLTSAVFEMILEGDTSEIRRPGQFVELQLPGLFLRRPISVCTWDAERLTLLYKVVGQGTGEMAGMPAGTRLNLLTGLGNGYDLAPAGESPLLLGGGVGVPPLYGLCQALVARGKQPAVVLGFNTQGEVFYEDRFRALGASVTVTTADGSYGRTGFVTHGDLGRLLHAVPGSEVGGADNGVVHVGRACALLPGGVQNARGLFHRHSSAHDQGLGNGMSSAICEIIRIPQVLQHQGAHNGNVGRSH